MIIFIRRCSVQCLLDIVIYIAIPPAQMAQCQDHFGHKSIGVGCSNQMQVAQRQVLH